MPRDVSQLSPREAELQAAIYEQPTIDRARAMRIKQGIEGYWRARGYNVDVIIADDGQVKTNLTISAIPGAAP